ncbi:MAG TPA: hypothetical protein VMT75_03725 [Candidatus Saccharimonadales bacterium]|nr:hypothetical protein [Candidatus Saccharimonadales bacterium]
MRDHTVIARAVLCTAALALLLAGLAPAETKPTPPGSVTFTVTAVGKKEGAPPISKDDVQLFQGKERKPIGDWQKGDQVFLAILIDNSIDSNAGGQWDYLREFIMSQPASTYIAVGYLQNNTTMLAQDFTQNKELAAKALRLPIGVGALGSSPYLATMDMLKRWPKTGPQRSILLITSGIDFFRGPGSGPFYPDLDPLISRAERQNTNIWTVYYPSASHRGHSFFLANNAQMNIDKLSQDTGAESFFLGGGTPVSIKPYLDEINSHLSNQYLLTFAGSGGTKGKYQSMKVKTELADVELLTPASVYLPAGQ